MSRGVGEGKHRAPGFADEGGTRVAASGGKQFIKVSNVPGDGEWLITAAPLPRLEDQEGVGKPACDRRRLSGRSRTTMQGDNHGTRPSVCSGLDHALPRRPIP